ncbi:MAG: hypothetical protein CMJ73_01585 [Planctomycetaceae bacterium]|nr:hypothetical protein [Planctomycetaceae bacterium]
MRRIILVSTVMALVFTVAADTASAQLLFKKIKQRRREELRVEIHAQLSDELSTKLDNDLAREMQIATDTIKKAAEEKIAVESKKLHQQFESAVTTLRKESDDRFVAGSKKLEELTANGIAEVQKKGRQIARQNNNFQKKLTELNGVFQADLTKKFESLSEAQKLAFTTYAQQFEEKLNAQLKVGENQLGKGEVLQDEIAKAIEDLDKVKIDMVSAVDDRLATIDEEIQNEVKKQIPAEKPEEDSGDDSAPESPAATTPSPVELKSEDSQDEGAGNDTDSEEDQ